MKGDDGNYVHVITQTPPILKERDGQWYIRVVNGDTSIDAPIGSWFVMQFMEKVIVPRLQLDTVIQGGKKD